MSAVDFTPDPNLHRVAGIAVDLAERIREEDPREVFDELMTLWHRHPAKAAQLTMTLAVWLDPATPVSVLTGRAERVAANRVELVRMGRAAS